MCFTFNNGSLEVIIRNGDLTKEPCDAVVNPTNISMTPDGGLDARMHEAMGQFFTDQVVAIHKQKGAHSCPVGQSRIFISKFNPETDDPRYVISTSGPNYTEEGPERAAHLLKSCYYTSLAFANLYQLNSIAFPAISCGIREYPPDAAARVAIESIREHSYNVKQVRFVLFDRPIYDVFVRVWTSYAEQVNKDANVIPSSPDDSNKDLKLQPAQPISPASKGSTRYCVLCKVQRLPVDRQLLCHPCADLPRAELFRRCLAELRKAATISYADLRRECQSLKPILSSYPLSYTPLQRFDQSSHTHDVTAAWYVQAHCTNIFRSLVPVNVAGDGNCLYNAFVRLSGVSPMSAAAITPIELRARNIIELVLNANAYQRKYKSLLTLLDDFEGYVRNEMVYDKKYTAFWDLLSIATVLHVDVVSVYPKVNGDHDLYWQNLNDVRFAPLTNEEGDVARDSMVQPSTGPKEVKILFSNCNKPVGFKDKADKPWRPNHFVPLLSLS